MTDQELSDHVLNFRLPISVFAGTNQSSAVSRGKWLDLYRKARDGYEPPDPFDDGSSNGPSGSNDGGSALSHDDPESKHASKTETRVDDDYREPLEPILSSYYPIIGLNEKGEGTATSIKIPDSTSSPTKGKSSTGGQSIDLFSAVGLFIAYELLYNKGLVSGGHGNNTPIESSLDDWLRSLYIYTENENADDTRDQINRGADTVAKFVDDQDQPVIFGEALNREVDLGTFRESDVTLREPTEVPIAEQSLATHAKGPHDVGQKVWIDGQSLQLIATGPNAVSRGSNEGSEAQTSGQYSIDSVLLNVQKSSEANINIKTFKKMQNEGVEITDFVEVDSFIFVARFDTARSEKAGLDDNSSDYRDANRENQSEDLYFTLHNEGDTTDYDFQSNYVTHSSGLEFKVRNAENSEGTLVFSMDMQIFAKLEAFTDIDAIEISSDSDVTFGVEDTTII